MRLFREEAVCAGQLLAFQIWVELFCDGNMSPDATMERTGPLAALSARRLWVFLANKLYEGGVELSRIKVLLKWPAQVERPSWGELEEKLRCTR